jgi:hypothetical protein
LKTVYFLCLLLLPTILLARDSSLYDNLLDDVTEEVFLSPREKEETEILRRIEEKNREDISKIRTTLKFHLRQEGLSAKVKNGNENSENNLLRTLEGIPNLGGLLWYSQGNLIFQWGDWSDFYEDGLSLSKLRREGQLPSFQIDGDQLYFFVKNSSGYFPVDFQFLGWESTFYVFGDEGSLRYTNDSEMDHAMRIADFRKIYESIKRKIPRCESLNINELQVFIVPGPTRPLYYALYSLRIFLYVWATYLFYTYLSSVFPFLKKKLPKETAPQN